VAQVPFSFEGTAGDGLSDSQLVRLLQWCSALTADHSPAVAANQGISLLLLAARAIERFSPVFPGFVHNSIPSRCTGNARGIEECGARNRHSSDEFQKECTNDVLHFLESASEKVVCAFNPVNAFGRSHGVEYSLNFVARTIHVLGSLHDQLRFSHATEVVEIAGRAWKAHANQRAHARVLGANGKSHAGAERKAHHANAGPWESFQKVIERGSHVSAFADAACELSLAFPHRAKIEPQSRQAYLAGCFCGAEHYFVVHGAAELGVRVTYYRRKPGVHIRIPLEQAFERPGRTGDQQLFEFRTSPTFMASGYDGPTNSRCAQMPGAPTMPDPHNDSWVPPSRANKLASQVLIRVFNLRVPPEIPEGARPRLRSGPNRASSHGR
jgi:hypothetical protein